MSVRLENIDELRKRANVSYEDAKEALERCNDDILEALVYLEKQNKINHNSQDSEKCTFWTKVKAVIRKGNNTKFIVKKNETGNILLSIPVTAAVVIGILAFHLTIIALIIALITGYGFKLEGKKGECDKVNNVFNKVSKTVDDTKKKLCEDDSFNTRDNQ